MHNKHLGSAQIYRLQLVKALPLRGYLHGLPQPALRLLMNCIPQLEVMQKCTDFRNNPTLIQKRYCPKIKLSDFLGNSEVHKKITAQFMPAFENLVSTVLQVQETVGWPIYEEAVIEHISLHRIKDEPSHSVLLILPSFNSEVLCRVLPWIFAQFSTGVLATDFSDKQPLRSLNELLSLMKNVSPKGTNTRYFLMSAYHLNVPAQPLVGQVIQYGWGSKSRWMDSSFTDKCSGISAQIARNKISTNKLLKRAGLPVPEQVLISSVDYALDAARRVGYPVVIKPFDLDGGRGVEAGLKNEDALRHAYARATRHSKNIIVERHIEGKDYRLGVLYGHLAWATYREPAGVYGDGVSTVEALIAKANLNPRRGNQSWSFMSPIRIDAEALELLQEQSVELTTVIVKDRFIRLRRAANISSGGCPVDVTESVHPDNVDLALRATRTARLDIAGVDLIMPDITRSWREVGGAICEINGQPQMSCTRPQAFSATVRGLFKGNGRIPVIVLLFDLSWGSWSEYLTDQLASAGINAGFALKDGAFVKKKLFSTPNQSVFDYVQNALLDIEVDALIVATNGQDWSRNGMPVDDVDLFVVDDSTDQIVIRCFKPASKNPVWKLNTPFRTDDLAHRAFLDRLAQFIKNAAKEHDDPVREDDVVLMIE